MNKVAILVLAFNAALCDDFVMKPMYKYRYETEDVMKTAESSIPVRGYHVVEGGYYPAESIGGGYGGGYDGGYKEGYGGRGYKHGYGGYEGGIGGGGGYIGGGGGYGGKFVGGNVGHLGGGIGHLGYGGPGFVGGIGKIGYGGGGIGGGIGHIGGIGGIGYGGGGIGRGIGHVGGIGGIGYGGGLGIGHHGYGGEELEKSQFSEGKKNLEDGRYEKAYGKKGGEFNQGQGGYSKDEVAAKDVKGDSGYYSNAEGGKQVYEDGKQYHGGQHFDKEGNV